MKRPMRQPRRWTPDEVATMLRLREDGLSPSQIAPHVGHCRSAVQKKLGQLDLVVPLILRPRTGAVLPVAQSEDGWMKSLTKEQLTGRRA